MRVRVRVRRVPLGCVVSRRPGWWPGALSGAAAGVAAHPAGQCSAGATASRPRVWMPSAAGRRRRALQRRQAPTPTAAVPTGAGPVARCRPARRWGRPAVPGHRWPAAAASAAAGRRARCGRWPCGCSCGWLQRFLLVLNLKVRQLAAPLPALQRAVCVRGAHRVLPAPHGRAVGSAHCLFHAPQPPRRAAAHPPQPARAAPAKARPAGSPGAAPSGCATACARLAAWRFATAVPAHPRLRCLPYRRPLQRARLRHRIALQRRSPRSDARPAASAPTASTRAVRRRPALRSSAATTRCAAARAAAAPLPRARRPAGAAVRHGAARGCCCGPCSAAAATGAARPSRVRCAPAAHRPQKRAGLVRDCQSAAGPAARHVAGRATGWPSGRRSSGVRCRGRHASRSAARGPAGA